MLHCNIKYFQSLPAFAITFLCSAAIANFGVAGTA